MGSLRYQRLPGGLPPFLLTLVCICAVVPFWALSFLPPPWGELDHLTRYAFYFGPWLVVASVFARTTLLLPAFLIECMALGSQVDGARAGVVVVMTILGVVLTREDMLFPLLQKRLRGFRSTNRLRVSEKAYIVPPEGRSLPAMIENVSVTGLGLSGPEGTLGALIRDRGQGGTIRMELPVGPQKLLVDATIVWFRFTPPLVQLGVTVAQQTTMERFLAGLSARPVSRGRPSRFANLWARSSVRRTAMVLWIASLMGAFGSPACGDQKVHAVDLRTVSTIEVDATVEVSSEGMTLVASDVALEGRIIGCASGHEPPLQSGAGLKLILGDRGCRAAPDRATVSGLVHQRRGESRFAVGDQIDYYAANGARLTLRVVSQLPEVVTAETRSATFAVAGTAGATGPKSTVLGMGKPPWACLIDVEDEKLSLKIHPVYLREAVAALVLPCPHGWRDGCALQILKLDPGTFEYKLAHPYVHKKKHNVTVIIAHREYALLTCSAKVEHAE